MVEAFCIPKRRFSMGRMKELYMKLCEDAFDAGYTDYNFGQVTPLTEFDSEDERTAYLDGRAEAKSDEWSKLYGRANALAVS